MAMEIFFVIAATWTGSLLTYRISKNTTDNCGLEVALVHLVALFAVLLGLQHGILNDALIGLIASR